MSDAPATPSALSSGVASRFVSASALEEAAKKRSEEWKAAYERIGQEPPKEDDAAPYDGRSLWEKLQENKNKKQEAFEEQLKFKNHFRALDEDEISFLDSMVEENNDEERERQKQIRDELLSFRKAVTARSTAPVPPALASTLSPSSAPIASSSSSTAPLASTSTAAAPKATAVPVSTTATAQKKGKKKSLPGLVLKKKKDTQAEGKKKPADTRLASGGAQEEANEVQQQRQQAAVGGTKRPAAAEGALALGEKQNEDDDTDGGANAKKRRVEVEVEVEEEATKTSHTTITRA
ncbi:hypothetical protein JCM5296_000831 [Sporobolomyces johnsonii]